MRMKALCGARTRRGKSCMCNAILTKRGALRCRLHGGLSTGPKTAEGRARISAATRMRWAAYRARSAANLTPTTGAVHNAS
jgi:hypothetical protein